MGTKQDVMEPALALARASRDADLADLFEELRIPSVSSLSQHQKDCLRNAEWLRARFEKMGMEANVVDVVEGGLPVVMAEWLKRPGKPTLTMYGHYDVQPPDPIEEWKTPPFEPTVRDGHVYARGCADNKGNHMVCVKAAEHLFAAGGPPINIRFLIEGEEEKSGYALPRYLRDNASKLKTDFVLIWDGGFDPAGRPTLANALRGIIYTELNAVGAAVDLHSGEYGGNAPNPINTLAHIISDLKDREGRITIPGFYDDVQPASAEELKEWAREDDMYAAIALKLSGAPALEGEPGFMATERHGSRPTLDANGIIGGFTGEGSKTVIPSRAMAKVSMRLVPNQDPEAITAAFKKYVQSLTTPGVKVTVTVLGSVSPPILCGTDNAAAKALSAAYKEVFGKSPSLERVGGSIPVTVDFQEALGAPLVISGIPQADCAVHSPNEHLVIDQYHKGIEAIIRFICILGA